MEQEADDEKQVYIANITSFNFNSISSVIVTKLDTSSSQNSSEIAYKIGTCSDGNLMLPNVFEMGSAKETKMQIEFIVQWLPTITFPGPNREVNRKASA